MTGGGAGALVVGRVVTAALEDDPRRIDHLAQRAHAVGADAQGLLGHRLENLQLGAALFAPGSVDGHLNLSLRLRALESLEDHPAWRLGVEDRALLWQDSPLLGESHNRPEDRAAEGE